MFVQGFGEVLTDVMTVNPALADLPSASAILDASNYTFQAVTFGKDAEGFSQHSHVVSTVDYVNGNSASGASSYDSGLLVITNYGSDATNGASSYVVSATYAQFSSTYNSVPNDPSPLDTRLERGSTLSVNLTTSSASGSFTSALPDLGHYVNAVIDPQLSAIWNKVGGFAASSGGQYRFYDKDGNYVYSGNLASQFNTSSLMDKDGYLTVSPSAATDSINYGFGAVIQQSAGVPVSGGRLSLNIQVSQCDLVTLASFGSVKHLGVYCLDLQEMLRDGLMPPYSWDALNNNRKYKMVAKSTILDNPFYHRDALGFAGLGFYLNANNITLLLIFDFK
jgi:hypothetical protein